MSPERAIELKPDTAPIAKSVARGVERVEGSITRFIGQRLYSRNRPVGQRQRRGEIFPCFGSRAERPKRARPLPRPGGPYHCWCSTMQQCHFSFSNQINSIQFQIKFKLLKFIVI
jgi:hypothetical protein